MSKDNGSAGTEDKPDQRQSAADAPQRLAQSELLSAQARLAHDARSASLRALAGRLAHQIRNPLAAVRAACSGLRAEIDDTDQRETLDLTLVEIDRMLGLVKATVQTIPDMDERPQTIDIGAETADVIDIMRGSHNTEVRFGLNSAGALRCCLPRHQLRATVYSILDHLAAFTRAGAIDVGISGGSGRVAIHFSIAGGMSGDAALTTGTMSPTGWVQPMGLLVAERFARDAGGRLQHADSGDSGQTFTLDLPCRDV